MFTTEQLAIISTRVYSIAYKIKFTLPTGEIKWTTLPHDTSDGYVNENYITGVSDFKQSNGTSDNTASIDIIGTQAMLAAFANCQGGYVSIDVGIYKDIKDIKWSNAFNGIISKYGISREIGKVVIALELTDRIGNMNSTNSRLLTPQDQEYRYSGDTCLKYMADSQDAVFWGKDIK